MKHYKGEIGEFDYDENYFVLRKTNIGERLIYNDNGYKTTDGSSIQIPKGILDCSGMFRFMCLTSPPVIPDGVIYATSMFSYCKLLTLKHYKIPNSIKTGEYMFEGCTKLSEAPVLSKSLRGRINIFSNTHLKKQYIFPLSSINYPTKNYNVEREFHKHYLFD